MADGKICPECALPYIVEDGAPDRIDELKQLRERIAALEAFAAKVPHLYIGGDDNIHTTHHPVYDAKCARLGGACGRPK